MAHNRPFWVWVIFIFTLLGSVLAAYSFYLVLNGSVTVDAATQEYFESLSVIGWVFTVGTILLALIGATALFMLNKIAVPLNLAVLAIAVLNYLYDYYFTDYLQSRSNAELIVFAVGIGIDLAIFIYAWALRNRGILT